MAFGSGLYFLNGVFSNISNGSVILLDLYFPGDSSYSSSLGWVGFSVAAVQLVPYFSFSHQLHLK